MNLITFSTTTDLSSTISNFLPDWARTKRQIESKNVCTSASSESDSFFKKYADRSESYFPSRIFNNKRVSTTTESSTSTLVSYSMFQEMAEHQLIMEKTGYSFYQSGEATPFDETSVCEDSIVSNLAFAIEKGHCLEALHEINTLTASKENLEVLVESLSGNYRFLIHLAKSRNMHGVVDILSYYKCYNLEDNSAIFASSRRLDNSSSEPIKSQSLGEVNETRFLNVIRKFRKIDRFSEQKIKDLVWIYPLFTKEDSLLNCLSEFKTKHSKFVITFLNTLILEGFPNGIENLISAERELEVLKNKFSIPPILDINILKNMCPEQKEIQKLSKFKGERNYWLYFSANEIAEAMTIRDACLIQSIRYSNIREWLQNKSDNQSPVLILEKIFQSTVSAIVLEIVKKLEEDIRESVINKFIEIGTILLENKNLHGALQFSLALSHGSVYRLLSAKQLGNQDYQSLIMFSLQYRENNETNYQPTDKKLLLPITNLFWNNLLKAYKEISDHKEVVLKNRNLKNLASLILPLSHYRTVCKAKLLFDESTILAKFLCRFEKIADDAIEGYSSLCKTRQLTHYLDMEVSLKEWTTSHFMKFLENEHFRISKMDDLLREGVYDGELFIEKFSNNNKITKGWSKDAQAKMLELYLKSKIDL